MCRKASSPQLEHPANLTVPQVGQTTGRYAVVRGVLSLLIEGLLFCEEGD
jgi:hypothetical protein